MAIMSNEVNTSLPAQPTVSVDSKDIAGKRLESKDVMKKVHTQTYHDSRVEKQAKPSGKKADIDKVTLDTDAVVEHLKEHMQNITRELQFEVEESSGRTVIKVKDANGDIIREIPPEEQQQLAEELHQGVVSLLKAEA